LVRPNVGWLVGLVPLALGIGFLTYFARSIALASEALNGLNPTRVSNDLLYDENGEIGVFIIDNEAYKVNRVWITGVGATSILTYNFTPIGISDAIDMLRNLGVEVSP